MHAVTDLLSDQVIADPYRHLGALRETTRVHRDEALGAWLVLRYDDVRAAFRDTRLSSDRVTGYYERRKAAGTMDEVRTTADVLTRWIVFADPPRHRRLRKLADYAFRPAAVQRMRGWIQALVDELIEDVGEGGEGGEPGDGSEIDFVERFAQPLPVRVICHLFGVPPEHRADLTRWSDDMLTVLFGAVHLHDRHERAERGFREFSEFLHTIIAERRAHPRDDLVSDLIAARERGDLLDEEEIVATCILLLFAGHETTRNLLANGLKAILQHQPARAALAADSTAMPAAVEEILRFDGPMKAMWRQATQAIDYDGHRIEPGERVLLMQASANRDPRRFDDPDTFDVARPSNRHVGFGYSIHYCLGANIARLEGTLGLQAFLARFPNASLATDRFEWDRVVLSRSLRRLPVQLGEPAAARRS